MNRPAVQTVRPQPLITVSDVERSSRWYQAVLGATRAYGGDAYQRLNVDGILVLQLHRFEVEPDHVAIGDPDQPLGNGLALWFEIGGFDAAVARSRAAQADVETDVHVNPNSGHRQIWLRDPDHYLVVLAEPYA